MKKIILLITISISLGNYSHAQNLDSLPTRKVLPTAVYLWQVSFGLFIEKKIFSLETRRFAEFSINNLETLYNSQRYGSDVNRVIKFCYYLEGSNIVKVALNIPEDPNNFLIYSDSIGKNRFVDSSYFKFSYNNKNYDKFQDWEDFVNAGAVFVYVREYRYNWSHILKIVGIDSGSNWSEPNDEPSLLIEHVAHTVSPADTMYEIRGKGVYEGYVALDLLFTPWYNYRQSLSHEEMQNFETRGVLNFAMPCPRNCPNE